MPSSKEPLGFGVKKMVFSDGAGFEPELFLFTAAKNYGHKCFITERKQREMGHNTEPLFVNKPPDVSSKPTEKRGL